MSDEVLRTERIVVDVHNPGRVEIMLLNTNDDAWGDHWLVWEGTADEADDVAEGIKSMAAASRELFRLKGGKNA